MKNKLWISGLGVLFIVIGIFYWMYRESTPLYKLNDSMEFMIRILPVLLIVLGICLIIVGIIATCSSYSNSMKPTVEKFGKVIEKNKHYVLVTVGDEGVFSIQGNWIIEYKKPDNSQMMS